MRCCCRNSNARNGRHRVVQTRRGRVLPTARAVIQVIARSQELLVHNAYFSLPHNTRNDRLGVGWKHCHRHSALFRGTYSCSGMSPLWRENSNPLHYFISSQRRTNISQEDVTYLASMTSPINADKGRFVDNESCNTTIIQRFVHLSRKCQSQVSIFRLEIGGVNAAFLPGDFTGRPLQVGRGYCHRYRYLCLYLWV